MAHENDSEVELSCEMADFIRPDHDLQWWREDELVTDNRTIVYYRDGQPHAAQNGGNETVHSRVSVLRISDPEVADSGTYICRIEGTDHSVYIQLTVEGSEFSICS